MNDDLQSALDTLAARASAEHHARTERGRGLPLDQIISRARHHRRTHTTTTAAAGVLAATLLAIGTTTLTHHQSTPAPATTHSTAPTPTPTPDAIVSPAPTVGPAVLPAADPSLPFGACGSVVGAATTPAAVPDTLRIGMIAGATEVTAGSQLGVTAWFEVDDPDRFGVTVVPTAGPRFLVVKDGVVVATDDISHGTVTGLEGFNTWYGDDPVHAGGIDLVVCRTEGTTTDATTRTPLPAGGYELWAVAPATGLGPEAPSLQQYGDEPITAGSVAGLGGTSTTAMAGPVPFSVTGTASQPQPHPAADTSGTDPADLGPATGGCGDDVAVPTPTADRASVVRIESSDAPVTVGQGDPLPLTPTIVYGGPGVLSLETTWDVDYWAVRDGVVVGTTWGFAAREGLEQVRLGNDARMDVSSMAPLLDCAGSGNTPLAPGEYELYLSFEMAFQHMTLDDGTTVPLDWADLHSLVRGPVALTVTP